MLARYHIKRREYDDAGDELSVASRILDPNHLESHGRYRAVLARLAMAESGPQVGHAEMLSYLHWAEDVRAGTEIVDAALLLAHHSDDADDTIDWLEHAIDAALAHNVSTPLPGAYNALAVHLDQTGRSEDGLEAYQQALVWERKSENKRRIIAACWAVGSAACRDGDWPLGRDRLEEAVEAAEGADDCADYLALSLSDLAQVYAAAGDVIEARRLMIRSMALADEQGFEAFWPERMRSMRDFSAKLDKL